MRGGGDRGGGPPHARTLDSRNQRAEAVSMESRQAENAEADAAKANAEVNARRNPKSESYGFALYIFASVLWVVWVLWAASPEWLLIQLGIEWFPHRYVGRRAYIC